MSLPPLCFLLVRLSSEFAVQVSRIYFHNSLTLGFSIDSISTIGSYLFYSFPWMFMVSIGDLFFKDLCHSHKDCLMVFSLWLSYAAVLEAFCGRVSGL